MTDSDSTPRYAGVGASTPPTARGLRLFAAYSQVHPLYAAAAVVAALGGAWGGCMLMGGSHNAGPHLFYIAIVLTAVRFTWLVTAVVAVVAGLLAGPVLPANVGLHLAQEPGAWILRLSLFVLIGVFIALLVENSQSTLRGRLLDALSSARLLRAIGRGEIEVFYQPIYRVDEDRLASLEALVRWRRPGGAYASPSTFIPGAERTGVVMQLDEYVLRQAASAAWGWQTSAPPLRVSVNLSAATLAQPQLVALVDRVLAEVGLRPDLLQVEITESALIDDLPNAIRQVTALRARGVKVAIDDFGSGQASLNYLQNLPIDVVKIDRSIVAAAVGDARSRRLLEGVSHLCELLDLQVVAEGVERPEQLTCLREIGVPMAQGFLLGRPAPSDQIHALLDVWAPR